MSKDIHTHTHTQPGLGLDIPIFTKLYEFYKNLYSALKLFPKRDRYALGQRVDNTTLEIFELLFKIGGVNKEHKIEILQVVSAKLDLLKVLLRLARDNQSLADKTYINLQAYLQEIGKMIGGWMRYLKNP